MAIPLGLVPPRPVLPGEEDPNAMPGAAPLTTSVGEGGGGTTLQVVAPPATTDTVHTTGPQQTTHQVLPSPVAAEGLGGLDAAAKARADAEARLAAEAVSRAEQEAKVEEGKQLAAQYAAAERARVKEEQQKLVDAAVARDMTKRQLMERASDNLGKSYWADKSAAYRILSAFVTGLGDYAHIKAGGQGLSPASQVLEDEIAKDRQQKIAVFQNSEKFQKLAAQDVDKAKDLMAEHLKDIDVMQSAMVNKLTGAMAVYAARSKIPQAEAEADKASAVAAGKDAELKAKLGEHYSLAITKAGARQDTTHTANDMPGGAKVPADLTVQTLDGKPRQARSLIEAEKVRDAYGAATGIGGAIDKLRAHVLEHGRTLPGTDEAREREQYVSAVTDYLTTLKNTGVLNANEYTRYTKATDTTLLSGREATAKGLDVLKNSMGDHYTANLMAKSIALPGEGAKPAAEPAPASPRAKPARARPSTADAKAIQWALKHSNDPLAKEILQENGH